MATDRFYFWRGYYDALKKLEPSDGYRLVMAMCSYAFDGDEPDLSDSYPLDVTWQVLRDQVSESVAIGQRMAEIGAKGGSSKRNASDAKATLKQRSKQRSSERKGTEVNGIETRSLRERGASRPSAVQARALAPDDDDDAKWRGDTL